MELKSKMGKVEILALPVIQPAPRSSELGAPGTSRFFQREVFVPKRHLLLLLLSSLFSTQVDIYKFCSFPYDDFNKF